MVAKRSSIDGSPRSSHGSESSFSSPEIPALDLTRRSSSLDKDSLPLDSPIKLSPNASLSPESIKFYDKSPASSPPVLPSLHSYLFNHESSLASGYSIRNEKRSIQESNNHLFSVASLAESDNPAKRPRYSTHYDSPTLIPDSRTASLLCSSQTQTQAHLSRFPIYPMSMVSGSVPLQVPLVRTLPTAVSTSMPPTLPASIPVSSCKSSFATSEISESRKTTRPFKAYTSNPRSRINYDVLSEDDVKRRFEYFRRQRQGDDTPYSRRNSRSPHHLDQQDQFLADQYNHLDQLSKQAQLSSSNKQGDLKDAQYWEKRKRNNEAAKRSRDARKAKEDEIALRAAFLEQEFLRLRHENEQLLFENTKMKDILWRKHQDCISV